MSNARTSLCTIAAAALHALVVDEQATRARS